MGATLSLRELGTFLAVARLGSALRAARALGYAQSTVSLHVANLERALGVQLFARNGKRLALTDAGRLLADEGRMLVEQASRLHARVHGVAADAHGTVTIGATEPVGTCRLPHIVAAFRRAQPRIHVSVQTGTNVATVDSLLRGAVDFVVCGRPQRRIAGTEFTALYEERVTVLVPSKHRFADRAHVRLNELAGEKILVSEETCAYRMLISAAIEAGNLDIALDATFGAIMTLPFAVAAGLGIAIVPTMTVTPPPMGTKAVELVRPQIALPVGIMRKKGPENAAAATLRKFVEEQLRSPSKSPRHED